MRRSFSDLYVGSLGLLACLPGLLVILCCNPPVPCTDFKKEACFWMDAMDQGTPPLGMDAAPPHTKKLRKKLKGFGMTTSKILR